MATIVEKLTNIQEDELVDLLARALDYLKGAGFSRDEARAAVNESLFDAA